MVYADYAASAPISASASCAIAECIKLCGNPSSSHAAGAALREVISASREKVARLIGCDSDEIYFTSGGTEACNLAVFGGYEYGKKLGEARIVTSNIEHAAVMRPIENLRSRGAEICCLGATERDAGGEPTGRVDTSELESALSRGAGLVSLMYANNETGVIEPVREAASLAHSAGAVFFSDAVAAAGHIPISVRDDGIDMLSISGHKIGAPAGIGALYVRRGIALPPMILGGGQERGLRSGTESALLIAAFGEAARSAAERMCECERIAAMRDEISCALIRIDGAHINGDLKLALPGTLNISFDGVDGEALANLCSLRGVYISAGSACRAGNTEPSAVLTSMGIPEARALGTVRISIGQGTTDDDVREIIKTVRDSVLLTRDN